MFKRIRNLLDISRYTVDELMLKHELLTVDGEVTLYPVRNGFVQTADQPLSSQPKMTLTTSGGTGMAVIINRQAVDPFKEFENETTE